MTEMKRKWYRSRSGILFGVCKGVAERLHLSVTFVRISWIVLFLLTGFFPFVLLYLLMAYFMPERDLYSDQYYSDRGYQEYRRRYPK